jgi:hemerythrin-like domain-containing protein
MLARRAIRTASGAVSVSPEQMWKEVLVRFEAALAPHFEVEERLLLPALRSNGLGALVDRTLEEHALIRECLNAGEDMAPRTRLARFGERLTEHIRFEERQLFETAQEELGDSELESIERASRDLVTGT